MATNRAFEIKIVKSKRPEFAKHAVTEPLKSKSVKGMPDGTYFICQYRPQKELFNGVMRYPSTQRITETVFNNNYVYDGIFEAISLGKDKGYKEEADGGLLIEKTEYGVVGAFIERNTPNDRLYYMTTADGEKIMNQSTNEPRKSSTLRFFVHESQDEEVRYQQELQRITNRGLWVEADDETAEETK